MLTMVLMGMLLLMLAAISMSNIKYIPNKVNIFDIKDTIALRGIFCLIIVMVHVPVAYQNKIQDLIGSFAYIGVTYFFMISAYGLKCGYNKSVNYLKRFWLSRGISLLLPVLIVNLLNCFSSLLSGKIVLDIESILHVDEWVKVLLLCYFLFWFFYSIPIKRTSLSWRDCLICIFVLVCSLIDMLSSIKITSIWPVECIGFIWGIVFYNIESLFRIKLNNRWLINTIGAGCFSLIIGCIYLKCKHEFFWGDYLLRIGLGVVIIIFLLFLLLRLSIFNKLNLFLGTISYEIYLIHGLVFKKLEHIVDGKINSAIYIWLSVIITIVIAILVHIVCEKVHCRFEMCLAELRKSSNNNDEVQR